MLHLFVHVWLIWMNFCRKFDVKHFNKLLKYAMNRILQDPNVSYMQIAFFCLTKIKMASKMDAFNCFWERKLFLPEQMLVYCFHVFQLQQFQFPVNKTQNPGYSDVIINPMNLSRIENKIENLEYTNSEAFLSDIKWILHNCSIYFSGAFLEIYFESKSYVRTSAHSICI